MSDTAINLETPPMITDADFQATLDNQRHVIPVTLTGAQLASVLCSAFDGGSTYWALQVEVVTPRNGATDAAPFTDVSAYLVPFLGGTLKVHLRPSGGPAPITRLLNLEAILDGVRVLSEEYPRHFADIIRDNADANTGDALLQCAIFGKMQFG